VANLTVRYKNHPGATEAIRNIVERNGGTGWSVDGNPVGEGSEVTASVTVETAEAEALANILDPEKSGVVQAVEVTG
jgi:hypothetical protein